MPSVFISYRRDDTAAAAQRLKADLVALLPNYSIYLDQADIEGAENYLKRITREIPLCDVFICLIGPQWLQVKGPSGEPRLSEPGDIVCAEIDLALDYEKDVLPILVDGAKMPVRTELPVAINRLSLKQAMTFDQSRAARDTSRIAWRVRRLVAGVSLLRQIGERGLVISARMLLGITLFAAGGLAAVNLLDPFVAKRLDYMSNWTQVLTPREQNDTMQSLLKERDDLRRDLDVALKRATGPFRQSADTQPRSGNDAPPRGWVCYLTGYRC